MFSGIAYAIGSMLGWGFGDFTIERTTIKIGALPSLFFITALGSVVLFPFAYPDLHLIFANINHLIILLIASLAAFAGSMMQFVAFERGKLSVIEPILGLELLVTIGLSISFGNEGFGVWQAILTGLFFAGLVLAITRHRIQLHYHKRMFERGVILSLGAAILYGLENFTIGRASQEITPLATIWFAHTVITILCLIFFYFFPSQRFVRKLKQNWKIISVMAIIDNLAWIFYAFAVRTIPISLAITIGESYIVLTVLLGLFANHDKIKRHQLVGIVLACVTVIVLARLHPG
jgi:drug/metabolite transporter (DMT)-like permease